MIYVEGYTAEEVEYCPFCGGENILYKPLRGTHTCEECKREFYVIEDGIDLEVIESEGE